MITKISKNFAQQIVDAVKEVCGKDINFINPSGIIFASTNSQRIDEFHEIGFQVARTGDTIEVMTDNSFQGTQKGVNIPFFHKGILIAVIGISGDPDEVRVYAHLAIKIADLLIREQELSHYNYAQQEKRQYIVHALAKGETGNPQYLKECLEEMGISYEDDMQVAWIKLNSRYNSNNVPMIDQKLNNLFKKMELKLFSYMYPSEYLVIFSMDQAKECKRLMRRFTEEYGLVLKIGVGSVRKVSHLTESYRDAVIALNSLSGMDYYYAEYEALDIEILLCSLKEEHKKRYLEKTISGLSKEDKKLLRIYFEEDMSLGSTGERLYMHKNTLQYKLNRIQKLTGFNPRKFRDASMLYLALKMEN